VFAEIGKNIVLGLAGGIQNTFGTLTSLVGQIPGRIRNVFSSPARLLYAAGQNIGIGLANGIGSLVGTVSKYAGYARSAVTGVFSGAGSLLYNTGKNIVIGLYNGIASLGSWLASKMRSFIDR